MAQPSGCPEMERLAALEHRATRNYFRLVRADRRLRARARGAPVTFGAALADALDAERRRLGREIHTGVGQSLAGIHAHLGLIDDALPAPPPPVRLSLDRIASLAATALEQVRGVSRRLYVPAWQARPLTEALRNLWESSGMPEKFAATLDLQELSSEPPLDVRRALYLAAQEGISNIIQHAHAGRARLSLTSHGGRVTLELEDDGRGLSAPDAAPHDPAGIGLRSLRDLARELGGELRMETRPRGATLTISLPVTHE